MKKSLLILSMLLLSLPAYAAYAPIVPVGPVATSTAGNGGAAFFPFAGAVGLMLVVTYLNAEGVPFPLCGVDGMQCYQSYPIDKNGAF